MKKSTLMIVAVCLVSAFTLIVACSKSDNNSTTQLTINMTDTPYNAQEVNIDIREVRVRFSNDSSSWQTLSTNARIYNILAFQNGIDTVLATGTVPTGTLQELRFVLGPNNSIKVNNITYPLTIPSGQESGLKIKIGKNLAPSVDSLLIDFDADASILQTGSGDYILKPVIKLK